MVGASIDCLEGYGFFECLYTLAEGESSKPFAQACLNRVALLDDPSRLISSQSLLSNLEVISRAIGDAESFNQLVAKMCSSTQLATAVKGTPFHAWLYDAIAEAAGFDDEEFTRLCVSGLEAAGLVAWDGYFRNNAPVPRQLMLLRKLKRAGIEVDLSGSFQESLNVYVGMIAKPEESEADTNKRVLSRREWDELVTFLTPVQASTLKEYILREATNLGEETPGRYFQVFESELSDALLQSKVPNVVSDLLVPLIERRKAGGVSWLRRVLDDHPDLLEHFPDKDQRALRKALRSVSQGKAEGGATGVIRTMADKLNLKYTRKKK